MEIHTNKMQIRSTGNEKFMYGFCDKSFLWKSKLLTLTRFHTDEKPFKCKSCQKSFTINDNLKSPMLTHTGSPLFAISAKSNF